MARLLKSIPNEWGPKFDGPSGAVTNTRTGPNQIKFVAPSHMALIMFTAQPGLQIALNGDRITTGIAPVGSLEIIHTIAKEAGFNSNSHMTATMRRVWGTTPTKLRNESSP